MLGLWTRGALSHKRTRRKDGKRASKRRRLRSEMLERRELLAANMFHNEAMPEDVNEDGQITPADALAVIDQVSRRSRGDFDAEGRRERGRMTDVNNDGVDSPSDALAVINRLSDDARQRRDGGGRNGGNQNDANDDVDNETPVDDQLDPGASDGIDLTEIQSFDGTGNNLENPDLGAAHSEFTRIVDADYADGLDAPSGEDRVSAREVSNIVLAQDESIESSRGLSDYIWQFGQFIDHDLDLTAGAEGGDGEEFNIEVPTGDAVFDPFGTGTQEIDLTRSTVADGTGLGTDLIREQVNEITAFIDGSMIYGSDAERSDALRSFEGGRLLVSEGDLLPFNTDGLDNAGGTDANLFVAGDVRANEQVGLLAMHTLWVREHNRVADEISSENPGLSDEEIFQEARRIVIGELQAITFNEYLPALLGRDGISDYEGYDSTVDPSISNLFATAAFRYGHSTLSPEIQRLDENGEVIEAGNLALRDAFFNPDAISDEGIDSVLRGLAAQTSQEVDANIIDDLRNFLFGPPGSGGFDLASLNIQRGRDHGLPDYNSVREQLGLDPVESFADITSDEDLQAALQEAYGNVDSIDVWVGALSEDHLRGASVGELASTIISDQFEAIRDGDRFWYENVLSGDVLREVNRTTLADVIERNTTIEGLQDNVFFVADAGPNEGGDRQDNVNDTGNDRDPRRRDNRAVVSDQLVDNAIDAVTDDQLLQTPEIVDDADVGLLAQDQVAQQVDRGERDQDRRRDRNRAQQNDQDVVEVPGVNLLESELA